MHLNLYILLTMVKISIVHSITSLAMQILRITSVCVFNHGHWCCQKEVHYPLYQPLPETHTTHVVITHTYIIDTHTYMHKQCLLYII